MTLGSTVYLDKLAETGSIRFVFGTNTRLIFPFVCLRVLNGNGNRDEPMEGHNFFTYILILEHKQIGAIEFVYLQTIHAVDGDSGQEGAAN